MYDEYNPKALIESHLAKKRIKKKTLINKKDKKRLTDFLIRKGFYWDSIRDVYYDWELI